MWKRSQRRFDHSRPKRSTRRLASSLFRARSTETQPKKMPSDPTLRRDLSLALLLAAVSSIPLVASNSPGSSTRLQLRDLVRTLTRAVVLSVATTGAIVLGGGAILALERVYYRWKGSTANDAADRGDDAPPNDST